MMRWLIIPFLFLLAAFGHAETMKVVGGSADKFLLVMMIGTDGAAETGLAFGDVTITWTFNDDGSDNDVTEQTMTMGVHAEGGWIEVDSTNSPGLYQFGIPDAAIADGSEYTVFSFKATDVVPTFKTVELIDADLRDAVRLGLTALPNAAADAAGGVAISDAGGLDLDGMNTNINDVETSLSLVLADTDILQSEWANGGRLDLLLDGASAPTAVQVRQEMDSNSTQLAKIDNIVTTVTAILADTTTLPSDPADDSDIDAQLLAIDNYIDTEIASIATTVTAILADTGNLPSDPADDSDIDAQLLAINNYVDTEIASIATTVTAILADTGTDGVVIGSLGAGSITAATFAANAITSATIAAGAINASEAPNLDVAVSSIGGAVGSGADQVTLNIQYPAGTDIGDASVWISTDAAGSTIVAGSLLTNDNGNVTFLLDDGSDYYLWAVKSGVMQILGEAFTAEAD